MNAQELATPVKGVSYTDLIAAIEPGECSYFPYEKVSTIRPLISTRIALMFPERVFETAKIDYQGLDVLAVKRSA
jgi:hypothetical protein